MAIAIFANEVKGKSMLALSRDLGTQYKTAFVLAHKIREAMASEVRQTPIGGEGKKAEIDGGFFGGHVRSANRRENRRDRRLRENQSGKRKVVVVIRERGEQHAARRVPHRGGGAELHSPAGSAGNNPIRRCGRSVE